MGHLSPEKSLLKKVGGHRPPLPPPGSAAPDYNQEKKVCIITHLLQYGGEGVYCNYTQGIT